MILCTNCVNICCLVAEEPHSTAPKVSLKPVISGNSRGFRRSSTQVQNVTVFFVFFMALYALMGIQLFGRMDYHCVLPGKSPAPSESAQLFLKFSRLISENLQVLTRKTSPSTTSPFPTRCARRRAAAVTSVRARCSASRST